MPSNHNSTLSISYCGGIGATTFATTARVATATTTQYNTQLSSYIEIFREERGRIAQKVTEGLSNDPSYTGARGDGVNLAWKYEQADIEMGGNGSAKWNQRQKQEIRDTGKVRGAEGHHQQNVSDHPTEQGNPNNIKFYKSRKEHLEKGHDGDFRNESNAKMIDKDKMLRNTNHKRIIKTELSGLGIAVSIGATVGFTIGFSVSLAQNGISPESLKCAFVEGGKSCISSAIQSALSYGIGRTVGQLASQAVEGILTNIGIEITKNISLMCYMGVVGVLTIAVFSVYQLLKLIRQGVAVKEALIQVGKQALFSLSLLAVSIVAQGIWLGSAGIIVSISIGIILISYSVADIVHQRRYSEFIREYMIGKAKPIYY